MSGRNRRFLLRCLGLGVLTLAVCVGAPSPARADCVHPTSGWAERDLLKGSASSLLIAAGQVQGERPARSKEGKGSRPCFRCGSPRDGLPGGLTPVVDRFDLCAVQAVLADNSLSQWRLEPAASHYSYQLPFDLERPPRAG